MIYPFGHKGLNAKLVNTLKSFSEIILLDYQSYYDSISNDDNLYKIKIEQKMLFSEHKIFKRIFHSINLINMKRITTEEDYDAILIMTYENISFSFINFLFKKKPVFLVHHNTIDLLNSRLNKYFFQKYMNKVNHIVFAEFIKEGLIEKTNVDRKRVTILEHPLSNNILVDKNRIVNNRNNNRVFVGLGLGSDEGLIKKLIELDKKESLFKKSGIKVILRSEKQEYESEGLKVFTGILPEDEYYELYNMASAYLLLYPSSYQNRFSGSILNALQSGKCVIGTDIPLVRNFSELYPNNCRIAYDIKHLLNQLITSNFDFSIEEYELFINKHSDATVLQNLKEIFDTENE